MDFKLHATTIDKKEDEEFKKLAQQDRESAIDELHKDTEEEKKLDR